jgi:hypothetical protein
MHANLEPLLAPLNVIMAIAFPLETRRGYLPVQSLIGGSDVYWFLAGH